MKPLRQAMSTMEIGHYGSIALRQARPTMDTMGPLGQVRPTMGTFALGLACPTMGTIDPLSIGSWDSLGPLWTLWVPWSLGTG